MNEEHKRIRNLLSNHTGDLTNEVCSRQGPKHDGKLIRPLLDRIAGLVMDETLKPRTPTL